MKTKIIATIHPNMKKKFLQELVDAGANILRINTKYINNKQLDRIISDLRKIKHCRIMIDIKDRGILKEMCERDCDYLAISFAEKASEIIQIKKRLKKNMKVISKIESKKGVENMDELIRVSDGIMIARGDLGDEIPIEKVPMVQKLITKKCNKNKKMSITATEMMHSMVNKKRPTRAEVSDIANAILEGSEGLLLAEETAIGKHPILVVKTMRKIIKEIEKHKREVK